MKICYIVGAGDFAYPFIPREDELVIAADGGYDTLVKYGIKCDVLIGDFDSVKEVPSGIKALRHPVEKDETDIHLALLHGASLGYSEFRIYGATGGRQDHTFANYSLLLWAKRHGLSAMIVSENMLISVIENEEKTIYGKLGSGFSVFALGNEASGITIEGAKYPLASAALTCDFPLGVSNSFRKSEVKISVKSGALLLMQQF